MQIHVFQNFKIQIQILKNLNTAKYILMYLTPTLVHSQFLNIQVLH